jgi:hypothetical protein
MVARAHSAERLRNELRAESVLTVHSAPSVTPPSSAAPHAPQSGRFPVPSHSPPPVCRSEMPGRRPYLEPTASGPPGRWAPGSRVVEVPVNSVSGLVTLWNEHRSCIREDAYLDPHSLCPQRLREARLTRCFTETRIPLSNGAYFTTRDPARDDTGSDFDWPSFSQSMTQWLVLCSEVLPPEVCVDRHEWWEKVVCLQGLEPWERVFYAKSFMMDHMEDRDWSDQFELQQAVIWQAKAHPYPARYTGAAVKAAAPVAPGSSAGAPGGKGERKVKRSRPHGTVHPSPKASRKPGGTGASAKSKRGKVVKAARGRCFSRTDPGHGVCTIPDCMYNHACINCHADHAAVSCPRAWDDSKTICRP